LLQIPVSFDPDLVLTPHLLADTVNIIFHSDEQKEYPLSLMAKWENMHPARSDNDPSLIVHAVVLSLSWTVSVQCITFKNTTLKKSSAAAEWICYQW